MIVIQSFKMQLYNLSLSFQVIFLVVFLMFVITTVESNENSMTVNSKSLLEIVSNKMTDAHSKLDLLLTKSPNRNPKEQRFELKTDNLICSLSSRVIEMENEIDALKSSPSLLPTNVPSGNIIALVSELRSEVEGLQSSFEKEKSRTKELEQSIRQLDYTSAPKEIKNEADDICKNIDFDIKDYGWKPLVHYLQQISCNVFLRKPSKASSILDNNSKYNSAQAVDEVATSLFHTKRESNPWLFVDLEVPHFIWEIRVTLREVSRSSGIKIYLANNVTFDQNGKPDVKTLPVFAAQVGTSVFLTMKLKQPGGMCGRYVIVVREIEKEYLILFELQGTGFALK